MLKGCWRARLCPVVFPPVYLSLARYYGCVTLPLAFLFDFGAEDLFIDEALARQARLPLVELTETKTVFDLGGRTLARVRWQTAPLSLLVSGNHREQIQFYLILSPAGTFGYRCVQPFYVLLSRRIPALVYRRGQRVWLSSRDRHLQMESQKLAPHFVLPFKVDRVVNTASVHMELPTSVKVHPTFHVSLIKPVLDSELTTAATDPPPSVQCIDGALAYTVRQILKVR